MVFIYEIKFGQAAKPGMGGHLPAEKVTAEIVKSGGWSQVNSLSHLTDNRMLTLLPISRR